ncbi:MAG: hypothetical protein AB9866_23210 [Syntrophobacteraceae bacterium]
MRKRVDNVQCLLTARRNIMLAEGQYFCRFNDSWEIWGPRPTDDRVNCLERIPDKQVLCVIEKLESVNTRTV